jgi:competence protein ComEA
VEEQVSLFQNIIERINKKNTEIVIIVISIIILFVNIIVFATYKKQNNLIAEDIESSDLKQERPFVIKLITVDISGAVIKSGVYEVSSSARLNDVIEKAGGLSDQADIGYFERTFNRARFLSDQEKIYIPSYLDVQLGMVSQSSLAIQPEYGYPKQTNNYPQTENVSIEQSIFTNINTASEEELDELPGIGIVTAEKIISNRPYGSVSELLERKIVKSNVYEQIKNMVGI